jgi:hypothetical protein
MWMQESCGPELFCRRRRYILKYLIGIGVAVALMALCVGWPIYNAAAQTQSAAEAQYPSPSSPPQMALLPP